MPNNTSFKPSTAYWAETHEVTNQPPALENYNCYAQDIALQQSINANGAAWAEQDLLHFGDVTGSAEVIEWGFQANENKPVLHTHDRHGKRVDEVRFHPAYHQLMNLGISEGIHASHWKDPRAGAHVARAAKYYLLAQVEVGHCCPITMTSAVIPALKRQPNLFDVWGAKIMTAHYDPRNIGSGDKKGLTVGMAMTEKQGGSDVRSNSTKAYAVDAGGAGEAYELVGHKYFVSAPMSDAFLVLAQTDKGISCFIVPRWRPDGSKNPMPIQKLKNKMGNISNASSEMELRGAIGWMVGEEGRGIPVILDMVSMTRFDCMVGSAAGMRQAIVQITHHCSRREAFGKKLSEHALMQNVLADLILESEAALALTMRVARALDNAESNEQEKLFVRITTAVGKYWICKRAPGHAYEAMECIGGSGVMEDNIMPRLFRESPINSIWEGSGNVQCLDMLRAMNKTPVSFEAFINELKGAEGMNDNFDQALKGLKAHFADQKSIEYRARSIVEQMALLVQASCLLQYGDDLIANSFCSARLSPTNTGLVYGTLPLGIDCDAIIKRATPTTSVA